MPLFVKMLFVFGYINEDVMISLAKAIENHEWGVFEASLVLLFACPRLGYPSLLSA